jgi:protein-S-isoprenylcysteine O-methyltransferase Ste14
MLTFASAGTVDFWQGWLFWASFWGSSIATVVYLLKYDRALLERRMQFGPQAEPRPHEKIIISLTFLMFLVLSILPGLDRRFGWSRVPAAVVIIANGLVIACFGFFILVMRENTFAASTIRVEAGQRVISTGPYAYVRHPMYTGGVVLILAMPLAMGCWWGLILTAIWVPLLVARILDEEGALSAQLAGYEDYRRAVPYRLVPLVW